MQEFNSVYVSFAYKLFSVNPKKIDKLLTASKATKIGGDRKPEVLYDTPR